MRVLSLYLGRLFLARFALLLFALLAVTISYELTERGDNVLFASDGDLSALPRYALLRLPDYCAQLLPIAALLAAILTLGELARHHELEVIWTTGISPMRLIGGLLPISILLVGAQFSINNWAIPPAMDELRGMGLDLFERRSIGDDSGAVWLRSGNDVLRIPTESAQSGRLRNVILFRRDESGMLLEQFVAQRAEPRGEGWALLEVERYSAETKLRRSEPESYWEGRIDLDQLARLAVDPSELSLGEIRTMIATEAYGQRGSEIYRTWLHHRIVSAFTPFLMIGLVISLAQFLRGRGTFTWVLIFALGVSFAFLVFAKMVLAMGEVGLLPPWLAAWAPPLILVSLIGSLLVFRESGKPVPVPVEAGPKD